MRPDLAFYVRWMTVAGFVAFVTIVCLITWDGMTIWMAWTGLAVEAAITGRVVVATFPPRAPRHPSTVQARHRHRATKASAERAGRSHPESA
jgi:hypothetical protein